MTSSTIPRQPRVTARTEPRLVLSGTRRHDDPAWARPLLIALLVGTLAAYLIDLTASGYANGFYAAAVQAGTKSWKAFFFGSIDSSNFITVDKPPASLWVMELFGRVFGFSSTSMLVPQVLEGVVSVALLNATVKRWFGAAAGLLAGAVLAVTPVAALMFRFNNPDALLVCLLVASAYCLVRALEDGGTRWMLGVGALLGLAFLAKMMQAFLVLPGFALVYFTAAPVTVRRRVSQLLMGGGALLLAGGWWVAIVAVWPAGSRPMIDGSPTNSIINLIFAYNGLSRLSGSGGTFFSGAPGVLRLLNDVMAGQASWLLPASGLVLVGGLIWRGRAPRTDRIRTALLLWGSWLVVSAAVFSFSGGIIHTYYTVALAPAIAALTGIGAVLLWQRREQPVARAGMATLIVITAGWAALVLHRTPSWESWLTPLLALSTAVAVLGLTVPLGLRRRLASPTAAAAVIACLAAPAAYTAQTITTAHSAGLISAGPTASDTLAGFRSGPGVAPRGPAGGPVGLPGGGPAGPPGGGTGLRVGRAASGRGSLRLSGAPVRVVGGAAGGGGSGGIRVSAALAKALRSGAPGFRWVAATSGSRNAASIELATGGEPVMAIGGFNGNGGNISLAQFKRYVRAADVHYYISAAVPGGFARGFARGVRGAGRSLSSSVSGLFGGSKPAAGPGGRTSAGTVSIATWVSTHYRSVTVGGQTIYDLTQPQR